MSKERSTIYTMGENAMTMRWGGGVSVGGTDLDVDGRGFAHVHFFNRGFSGLIAANTSDLRAIAAQMLEAADECDALEATKR